MACAFTAPNKLYPDTFPTAYSVSDVMDRVHIERVRHAETRSKASSQKDESLDRVARGGSSVAVPFEGHSNYSRPFASHAVTVSI